MADKCDELVAGAKKTDNALAIKTAEKVTRGKNTFNQLMNPIRELKNKERTATGAEKQNLVNEIAAHYSEAGEKATTKEKTDLTSAMIGNSDVQAYIHSMSIDEFATTRMELQTTFGGPQARIMEIEFKDTKLKSLNNELTQLGKNTPAVQEELATMGARGILSDQDLNRLRALEEYKTFDDSIIAPGTSRKTYTSLKSKLGEPITNEIFANKVNKNLEDIREIEKTPSMKQRLFRQLPSKDEEKIIEDLATGKRTPDANMFEATQKILNKLNDNGWKTLRGAIQPLEELDGPARTAVGQKVADSWLPSKRMIGGGAILALLFSAPAILIWSSSGITNLAEMTGLYQQFNQDKTPSGLLRHFFGKDKIIVGGVELSPYDQTTLFFQGLNAYDEKIKSWLNMPIYGEYLKLWTLIAPNLTPNAIRSNYGAIYTDMQVMGLVTPDDSIIGFRETTDEERKQYYANNPRGLYETEDSDWIKTYSPWTTKTGIYKKDGEELRSDEAMALYYADKGLYNIDLLKLGLTNIANDQSAMDLVRQYGKLNDKTRQAPQTTTYQKTPTTMNDLVARGLKCEGRNCTEEVYNRLLNLGWTIYEDPITGKPMWAQTQREIPKDAIGNSAKILNQALPGTIALTPDGSSGDGDGDEESTGREEQVLGQIKKGTKKLDTEALGYVKKEGKVDIEKLVNSGGSITDAADLDKAGTISGFDDYAKKAKSKNKIDKNVYEQMSKVDKKAANKAVVDAYRCGT